MRTALALAFLMAAPVAAQDVLEHVHGATCTLYDIGEVAQAGPPLAPEVLDQAARRAGGTALLVETRGRSSTFQVTYTGFTPEAQAAFQAAVDIWADHLISAVPIRVEASFGPLGERVLGSAGPRLTANFTNAPAFNTWYPFALADAIAGADQFPAQEGNPRADIVATFSSTNPNFYFGTDGNPPSDKFDFMTIVLHELGHGLGFVGSGDVDDGAGEAECDGVAGNGCWGIATGSGAVFPFVFDGLVESGGGIALLNTLLHPQNSPKLGSLLQSQDLFVDAPTVLSVNGGVRPEIWAPATFDAGSSFSHWDEIVFTRGTSTAMMTPLIGRGEAYQDPGTITCAFFQDMGWRLGPGCSALFSTPAEAAPGTPAADFVPTGPNPFRSGTSFALVLDGDQPVTVRLLDALGREVRTLFSGLAGVRPVPIEIDGDALAPGAYTVLVEGETVRLSAPVVRVH